MVYSPLTPGPKVCCLAVLQLPSRRRPNLTVFSMGKKVGGVQKSSLFSVLQGEMLKGGREGGKSYFYALGHVWDSMKRRGEGGRSSSKKRKRIKATKQTQCSSVRSWLTYPVKCMTLDPDRSHRNNTPNDLSRPMPHLSCCLLYMHPPACLSDCVMRVYMLYLDPSWPPFFSFSFDLSAHQSGSQPNYQFACQEPRAKASRAQGKEGVDRAVPSRFFFSFFPAPSPPLMLCPSRAEVRSVHVNIFLFSSLSFLLPLGRFRLVDFPMTWIGVDWIVWVGPNGWRSLP